MAKLSQEALAELLAIFREEARENLAQISGAVLALEQAAEGDARGLLETAARRAHNLKGAANTLGLEQVSKVTHAFEQALLGLNAAPRPRAADALLRAVDWLTAAVAGESPEAEPVLEQLAQLARPALPADEARPATLPPTGVAARPPTLDGLDGNWVRVPLTLLEEALAPLAALVPLLGAESQDAGELEEAREQLEAEARRLAQVGGAQARASVRSARELARRLERLARGLRNRARQGALALSELEDTLRRARLIPIATLEPLLVRAVRDAAQRTLREVSFSVERGEVGLDRHTLERLREPLLHLVRNAVAHGIEPAEERKQKGKPRQGKVWLRAFAEGESITLEVGDDGAGVDLERVRARALERGLLAPSAAGEADAEHLTALLFQPGFSTAGQLTELAGRGIGLDAVRAAAEALGGTAELRSQAGQGASVRISVPLRAVSTRVLLVRSGEQRFAIPAAAVERVGRLVGQEPFALDGARWLHVDGQAVKLLPLVQGRDVAGAGFFAVLTTSGHRAGFAVDEIAGEQDVVVEALGPPVRTLPGVLGASVLPSGEVVVVLNPAELGGSLQARAAAAPAQAGRRLRVLVVDDSLTTRTLESHILESCGFEVRVAHDGQEALDLARGDPPDLVISDVEMPRLDGVGLTAALRADPRLAQLPVILVTSLGSDDDRRRGMAAGANAYLVKSRFDQQELLATIHRLVG